MYVYTQEEYAEGLKAMFNSDILSRIYLYKGDFAEKQDLRGFCHWWNMATIDSVKFKVFVQENEGW